MKQLLNLDIVFKNPVKNKNIGIAIGFSIDWKKYKLGAIVNIFGLELQLTIN